MKAWMAEVKGFPGMLGFYAAPKRSRAQSLCHFAANDAGFTVKWTDIAVKRCKRFDDVAQHRSQPCLIGYLQGGEWFGDVRGCADLPARDAYRVLTEEQDGNNEQ